MTSPFAFTIIKNIWLNKLWKRVKCPFKWKKGCLDQNIQCAPNYTCKSDCILWHPVVLPHLWAKADCFRAAVVHSQKSFWCRTRTHFICLADLWPCLITCIHSDYSFLICLCKQELTGKQIFRGAGAQIKTYPVIISLCFKCNYCTWPFSVHFD